MNYHKQSKTTLLPKPLLTNERERYTKIITLPITPEDEVRHGPYDPTKPRKKRNYHFGGGDGCA